MCCCSAVKRLGQHLTRKKYAEKSNGQYLFVPPLIAGVNVVHPAKKQDPARSGLSKMTAHGPKVLKSGLP
jgi:hypothetical protein